MKEESCNCGCILVGRKFLNENNSIDKKRLATIFERWFREMKSVNTDEQLAFTVINDYAENLCDCSCHVMKEFK